MSSSEIPLWRRPVDAFAGSRFGSAILRRLGPLLDRPLLRFTRGRVAMTLGLPTLLLTTIGRRSGAARAVPLVYHRLGDDLAVIGTSFGSTKHPAWYLNLRAKPEATVLLGGKEFTVGSRDATPAEYHDVWARATRIYGGYDRYRRRVGRRRVPIVVLMRKP
jgi:deazaflavin-dependent oxidoreductase (nitroreductase family)